MSEVDEVVSIPIDHERIHNMNNNSVVFLYVSDDKFKGLRN